MIEGNDSRRIRVKKLMLACICVAVVMQEIAVAQVSRPNIVLIMADDLGYGDLGCYGQKMIETPRIDRLASQGMRFSQAYAGGPVCTASRSVLMTGLHNGHTPARDNVPHFHTYLEDDDVTIAELLRNAGYKCGGVGKWSLGDAGTVGRATNQGFDHWFGYLNQDHAHHYYPEYLDDDDDALMLEGNSKTRKHYSHDLLTNRAIDFIRSSRDEPFFLYVAYTIPHFSAKSEDADGLAVPSTAPYDDRPWPEAMKKYGAMVDRLDRDVGRLTDVVDQLGLAEKTLVIFTSDNGGHKTIPEQIRTNGPLRGYKRDLTEGGIRVPFIARWPNTIPSGRRSDAVIAFQDMMPTFARLAGVDPPKGIDGVSIAKALRGEEGKISREYLYWDYGHCRPRYHQAVRIEQWKGILSEIRPDVPGNLELYDLSADLGEREDVAEDHPEMVRRMEEVMRTAMVPSEKYPLGKIYRGGPIWTPEH